MLTLLYGTRSARAEIYKKISEDVSDERRAYLIVPDQKALLAEEALMRSLPKSAALLVDAVGFSRLANLVCRRYGSLTYRYATDGAKAVTMYRAIKKLRPKLKVFGGEIHSGILEALCALMREFRTCSVNADSLLSVTSALGGSPLADKLSDLALLYTEYESVLHKNFTEAEDDLDTLAALLSEHDFFGDSHIYIDSFVSFTKQELTIIGRMLSRGADVTVALPFSRRGAHMAECKDTRKKLLSLCSKLSVKMDEQYLDDISPEPLSFAKANLWDFSAAEKYDCDTSGVLEVVRCSDKNEEASLCLKEIYRALSEGHSYSDIAIIARNSESYAGILDRILKNCDIPYFFAKKTDVSLLPLTGFILSALSLYTGDFQVSDVTSYIKSGLAGLSDEECDIFEEYIDRWNINGRARYLDGENFTMSKDGYTAEITLPESLADINETKQKLAAPLARFCDSLDGAKTVKDFATALYEYLDELGIREASQREEIACYFGVDRSEDAVRLWNVTLEALDTLVDAADDSETTAAEFVNLLKILFSAIDIASIPSSKDQIIIGNADTVRIDERKIVIILGAVEGIFPASVSESPTLCESERKVLEQNGVSLSQNLELRSARELYHFVRAIDFATTRAVISYYTSDTDGKSTENSFALARLRRLFTNLKEYTFASLSPADKLYYAAAAAESIGSFDKETEAALKDVLSARGTYTPPLSSDDALTNCVSSIDEATAKEIYGESMRLSQSKIDSYSDCKFRHFMQYILGLEDTSPHEFNPANIGTFIHSVLENFIKDAIKSGRRIADFTEEEIDSLAKSLSARETERILASAAGKGARMLCFFDRMYRNIRLILCNLINEFKNSDFEPFLCEYKIGTHGHRPLTVTLSDGAAVSLNGIADRIDICKKDGKVYLRVVDYKTGKKDFSERDLVKGKNLQLLIYLFSLCHVADKNFFNDIGVDSTDDIAPAGAVYFVVKSPSISKKSLAEGEDILSLAESMLERKGFVFSVDELGNMIDKSADKAFTKKLAEKDSEKTRELYKTVCESISNVADDMRSGRIDTLDTDTGYNSPCRYCKYVHVCRKNTKEGEDDEYAEAD